jgi:PAS domain S-box-containing protein
MSNFSWHKYSLIERVRWLRYGLPPLLVLIVLFYQLTIARQLEDAYGHTVHYSVEIGFYSLVGPVATWLTLRWVEGNLIEKEKLEKSVRIRTQQIVSLTSSSDDAILSLDRDNHIISWNQGAERIFGYSLEEVQDQKLTLILPNAFELLPRKNIHQHEMEARTKDGQNLTVGLTLTTQGETLEEIPFSLAIIRDITYQKERAAILEEERARIARDLHDGVAQTLYFLAIKADTARTLVGDQPEQAFNSLMEIGKEARQAIKDVRRAIFGLQPLEWTAGNFLVALEQFIRDFSDQVEWAINIQFDDSLQIPQRLVPTVFRFIQESLNNVAKHAEADSVKVTILSLKSPRRLLLKVKDNGQGFEKDSLQTGIGLTQMEKRLLRIGGTLHMDSSPSKGTIMTAEIPLKGAHHG